MHVSQAKEKTRYDDASAKRQIIREQSAIDTSEDDLLNQRRQEEILHDGQQVGPPAPALECPPGTYEIVHDGPKKYGCRNDEWP